MKVLNLFILSVVLIFCMTQLAFSENLSLQFDGKDDYVLCGTKNLPLGNDPRSGEAWVKTESPDGYLGIFEYGTAGVNNSAFCLLTKGGSIVISQWGASVDVPVKLNDGKWHHLAVTHDGKNKQTIFFDGKAVGNWNQSLNSVVGIHIIGACLDKAQQFFVGQIDEVRLWKVERTEAEIKDNMNKSMLGNEANLVGNWNFNEGKGLTANDTSANKNHGELTNGTEWVKSDAPVESASVDLRGKITSLWGTIKIMQ